MMCTTAVYLVFEEIFGYRWRIHHTKIKLVARQVEIEG
jgi:hypothetical protein